jgi:TetR/AcrR family transcriptional repressor of lfrA
VVTDPSSLSPTSRRTRRLIVDTAIDTLGRRHGATLAEIADDAGVSRSTLHRHFADRDELLAAIDAECRSRFDQAAGRARLTEGTALAALERLGQEFLELDSVLSLIFADNALVDPDRWEAPEDGRSMSRLIERGRQDGSLDPDLRPDWIETAFWGLLISAWMSVSSGMARREVSDQLSHTLRNAFSSR